MLAGALPAGAPRYGWIGDAERSQQANGNQRPMLAWDAGKPFQQSLSVELCFHP
jgi:hypothetical protein